MGAFCTGSLFGGGVLDGGGGGWAAEQSPPDVSECSGGLPLSATTRVSEFEGKVSWWLPPWALGVENLSFWRPLLRKPLPTRPQDEQIPNGGANVLFPGHPEGESFLPLSLPYLTS